MLSSACKQKDRASQAQPEFADVSRIIVYRKENAATHTSALIIPAVGNNKLRFFFNDTATTEIYTLSLHDALPIWLTELLDTGMERYRQAVALQERLREDRARVARSEEHTSELQSQSNLVCRL